MDETSIQIAPECPRCGSSMVMRIAQRGKRAGQAFWGCTAYPSCRGIVNIGETDAHEAVVLNVAGASAQLEFVRRVEKQNTVLRQRWPLFVGLGVIVIVAVFFTTFGFASSFLGVSAGFRWAGAMSGLALLLFLGAVLQLPQTTEAWRKGAAGERRTAKALEGLEEAGFVGLHDRRVPGLAGNVDHVAIGPSGVWVIETKALRGKVVIEGDDLRIGGRPRDRIVDQVYREAAAVQVVLRDLLDPLHLTVQPVICLHEAELPWFNKTVRGVRLASSRQLQRLLRSGEDRLDPEMVQRLAAQVDRRLGNG